MNTAPRHTTDPGKKLQFAQLSVRGVGVSKAKAPGPA